MWHPYIPHIHPSASKPVQSVLTLLSARCWNVTPRLQIRNMNYLSPHLSFFSFISFRSHYIYTYTPNHFLAFIGTLDTHMSAHTPTPTHSHTHLCLPALKPESVSVKSPSYFSGWWNILPRSENIINNGLHCLLSVLACIRNVIILQPATSLWAFIACSDHNNKNKTKKYLIQRKMVLKLSATCNIWEVGLKYEGRVTKSRVTGLGVVSAEDSAVFSRRAVCGCWGIVSSGG